ncbi:MAG: hemolysin family protein [Dehalococcoidia bacterium]|nr:hemolysin family protein [Dehalococcoidia bacterium]
MPSATFYLYLSLLIGCVLLVAFFNIAEAAFISLERYRLQTMVDEKVKGAGRVAKLLEKPERLLSTILTGQNLMSTAAVSVGTVLAVSLRGEGQGVVWATIILTVVLLVFGESTPKTIAVHHRERLALSLGRPVELLSWLFMPVVTVLGWVANLFTRILGSNPQPVALVRPEDIESMIAAGHRAGTVEQSEAQLLSNVFDFGDRPVREAIVPRPEVVSIHKGATLAEFLAIYAQNPMSRFPVYEENMDNVVGILSIKDVLMSLARDGLALEVGIDDLIRPAYFAPDNKPISDLFHEMRDKNFRMSVIVDEYGGTAGVVSLSRLMEEIVGPVGDEFSAAEKEFESINENTFQVDGGMHIGEINEELRLELPEGDYETIAGFILHLLGRFPKRGQQVQYDNLKMVVTKMKGLKIEEVLITKEKTTPVSNEKKPRESS